MGQALKTKKDKGTFICDLVGGKVEVGEVGVFLDDLNASVSDVVLGDGQFCEFWSFCQVFHALVSETVIPQIKDL